MFMYYVFQLVPLTVANLALIQNGFVKIVVQDIPLLLKGKLVNVRENYMSNAGFFKFDKKWGNRQSIYFL